MRQYKLKPSAYGVANDKVESSVEEYLEYHKDEEADGRKANYADLVNHFYDLVTDFYEWGWGASFHFSIQAFVEGFNEATARHEHYLALKCHLNEGMKVLDVGCGIGGPARNISRFSRASVIGLNNNQYQVIRATQLTKKEGLQDRVSFIKGDFMHQPFEDNSFDGVYQIEATAHAPDKVKCYAEIFRVLKPGQLFASYEWCMTDKHDPTNPQHVKAKKDIEEGNALPDIFSTDEVVEALEQVGFEVLERDDLAASYNAETEYPWYYHLVPSYVSPYRFQFTGAGRFVATKGLNAMEMVGLMPKGSAGVSGFLNTGAEGLVVGGQLETFTPMFFTLARKPLVDMQELSDE